MATTSELVKQIDKAWENTDKTKFSAEFDPQHPPAPILFEAVLGSKSQKTHWWRLYIDPQDWEEATMWTKKSGNEKHDPGAYYDSEGQHSKGFQKAMLGTYEEYLANGKLGKAVVDSDFGWEMYKKLWEAATNRVTPGEGMSFEGKDKLPGRVGNFGAPETLASDVFEDSIGELPLVKGGYPKTPFKEDDELDEEAVPKTAATIRFEDHPEVLFARLSGHEVIKVVDDCFKEFKVSIPTATSCRDLLLAIARLVRRLHMIHPFSDGSGRTNVFSLLPALLLRLGFGLPLGGKNKDNLTREALYELFNGGYSLDEIAKFLWLAQDFGLMATDNNHTVI